MTATTGNGWASTQASATAFALWPVRRPSCSARARRSRLASFWYTRDDSPLDPAKKPPACADQASSGIPVRACHARDSASVADRQSGHGGSFWTASERCGLLQQMPATPRAAAYAFASSIRGSVQLETPNARSSPARRCASSASISSPDVDGGIVAVQEVEIDRPAQALDAVAQVARDVRGA